MFTDKKYEGPKKIVFMSALFLIFWSMFLMYFIILFVSWYVLICLVSFSRLPDVCIKWCKIDGVRRHPPLIDSRRCQCHLGDMKNYQTEQTNKKTEAYQSAQVVVCLCYDQWKKKERLFVIRNCFCVLQKKKRKSTQCISFPFKWTILWKTFQMDYIYERRCANMKSQWKFTEKANNWLLCQWSVVHRLVISEIEH